MLSLKTILPVLYLVGNLPILTHAEDHPTIDDHTVLSGFTDFLNSAVENGSATSAQALRKQLERRKVSINLPDKKPNASFAYDTTVDSVAVLASIYKCPNCSRTHNSTATAWALTSDGVMASNYHVFENANRIAFGVATLKGKFFAITEILAANQASDVAIFRVKADKFPLTPLPLAITDAPVGTSVNVISHPDGRFYTYTSGKVSRYHKKKITRSSSTWMSITADYARGSSGGPVMNDAGVVVGMVANTNTIYYKNSSQKKTTAKTHSNGPVQMVIKNCVPAHALRELIDAASN